jgi:Na+/H+ antiporter NhaD/arsenite permease-like protein
LVIDELDDVFAEPQLEPESGTDWATRAHDGEPGDAPTFLIGSSAPGAALLAARAALGGAAPVPRPAARPLDIFALLEKIEWDTLLFFYGVLLGVGGLGALGYLALTSEVLYGHLGATPANVLVGVFSALVDNVPVMFAVLQMGPDMSRGQWLLVTLTTGVGGSLLSVGSAAGVALMGQARGVYTFGAHLRWTWAVALGFVASVGVHLLMQEVLHVWG